MLHTQLPSLIGNTKQILKFQSLFSCKQQRVPKGHIAIYVGEAEKKRYVVPLSYLSHEAFRDLLKNAEEEFEFCHPMGGLTIPCKEEDFIHLACQLDSLVPKGHVAIYIGEGEKKRFVVPLSYLNQPVFEDLLKRAEEEFGFYHPMGGLTIPCNVEEFNGLASQLCCL
ncbi:hypothetical protein Droror1_Dr00001357 [Drosera rotundifolia]